MTSKFETFSKRKRIHYKSYEHNGYIHWMNTGMDKIHPTQVIFISDLSGCLNITMNFLYTKQLKVLFSCGIYNNTY